MRKREIKLFLSLLVLLPVAVGLCQAEGEGTSGADFINIGVGARATGMGDAQSAVGVDSSVMYWNPAGLGNLTSSSLSSMYSSFWFSGISYNYVGYAHKLDKTTIGVGATMLSMGEIPKTIDSPDSTEFISALNSLAMVSVCQELVSGVYLGVTGKIIYQSIDSITSLAYDGDVGIMYKTSMGLTVAVAAQNLLGSEVKFDGQTAGDALVRNYKLGLGFNVPKLAAISADLNYNEFGTMELSAGAEASLLGMMSVRVGGKFDILSGEAMPTMSSALSMGIGFNMNSVSVDCALLPFSGIDNVYKISMSMRFGGEGAVDEDSIETFEFKPKYRGNY